MSDRPAPLTRTDELIGHLIDEVAGLRADLAKRGGTPPAPAPVPKPGPKGRRAPNLDGR